jgi:hypothetical protein
MQECIFNYPNLKVLSASVCDLVIVHNSMIFYEKDQNHIYGETQGIKLGVLYKSYIHYIKSK